MAVTRFRLLGPVLALLLLGCGGASDVPASGGGTTEVSDFSLVDVNPSSATSGEQVSPRDFLGKVSAWYFGHAT